MFFQGIRFYIKIISLLGFYLGISSKRGTHFYYLQVVRLVLPSRNIK
jgi:hypothetical protein